jgi:hypothetical protein
MGIANATDPYKVTRSFTTTKAKGASFGPQGPRVPDIESIATDEYDSKLAYVMSVISTWSYADEKALAEKLRYYGIDGALVRRITVQNDALLVVATAYFIQSRTGRVGILAFRGTDPASFITILADAETMQRPFANDIVGAAGTRPFADSVVHSGFYANVEAVWDDVVDCLDAARKGAHIKDDKGTRTKLDQPLDTLYITGHSLGGAMAVLAAARLFGSGFDKDWTPKQVIKGVYTFGQPMVGNEAFAGGCEKTFGGRLFRHVYRDDVVPHLPPTSELNYRHTGEERRADALNDLWKSGYPPSKQVSLTRALIDVGFNAVEARLTPSKAPDGLSVDDHMPSNYLDVSRYVIDPGCGYVVATGRRWIEAVVPARFRGTVRSLLTRSNGGSSTGPTT